MINKYEVLFDKLLIGHTFEGDLASDYLSLRTFFEEDLKGMSEEDLIELFTKAIVTLKIEISNNTKLTNEVFDLNIEAQIATMHAKLHKNSLSQLIAEIPKIKQRALVKNSSKGGYTRAQNSIKHQEKKFVFECWEEWQLKPQLYKNKTQFAKDMIRKFDHDDCEAGKHIQSEPTICAWCREWEKMSPSQLGAYSAS